MILACQNISKSFGTDTIIQNVSFHVEDNEKTAIVGINGAGKSTLLKIIVGELAPDSGEVTVAKGKTIGYLAQYQDKDSNETIYNEVLHACDALIEKEEKLRKMEEDMQHVSADELEKYMDNLLENRTLDEIQRQAGILGSTILDNADTAHSIVNASFHNATYSDRIWMHQDLLKHDLESLLASGLIQGKNPNELARLLRKRFDVKISDAQRLMRTELARVQIAAQQKSYEANGFDEYEYITCGIGDACDTCRALDGKVFPINRMNIGDNAPPMHPNCHCSTGPHMDRKIYNEWLDGLANGKHSLRLDEYKKISDVKNDLKKQVTVLSKSEKEILTRYTGNLAMQINFALNTGRERKFKKEIAMLDHALSKGKIPDDLILYRKIDSKVLLNKRNVSDNDMFSLKGTTKTEKGYLSTSFKNFDYKLRDVNLVMKIPKGYKGALYIEPLAKESYKNQDEVLFKRGVCYNICEVKKEKDKYTLIVEVKIND